jgi:hypothetical protein
LTKTISCFDCLLRTTRFGNMEELKIPTGSVAVLARGRFSSCEYCQVLGLY